MKKRIFGIIKTSLIAIAAGLIVSACGGKSDLDPDSGKTDPTPTPTPTPENYKYNASKDKLLIYHEFRASWLTTVGGYDWPAGVKDATLQQNNLRNMIHGIKNVNCNVVIMQVCCNSDAMWKSDILPWSSVLTGTQGKDPGYDPLALAIQTAHADGMEIHAWINPMRVGAASSARADNHPSKLHPDWVQQYGSNLYWDPANPEVIDYLNRMAKELMTNYDLDGLHIDDYFYPDGLKADAKEWDDSEEYALYGGGLTLEKWRESNINKVVKALYDGVHSVKPDKVFGVSPAGRLPLTRYLYADPVQWVEQGTVDYLAPQVYWHHGHSTAPFLPTMNTWKDVAVAGGSAKKIPVITGLAPYRLGETGFTNEEFLLEVEDCRKADWVIGNIWFRTAHLLASSFASYVRSTIYPRESLIPKVGKGFDNTSAAPAAPTISLSGKTIKWTAVAGTDGYALYELVKQSTSSSGAVTWKAELVTKGDDLLQYMGTSKKNYAVLAFKGKEYSKLSSVVYVE
ncbi:MAG: family 10 glycosylhydrolase [Bacteroidales bacterium]|nr:family 10 glycosylhydrolase [Bacteroidales bacterium]